MSIRSVRIHVGKGYNVTIGDGLLHSAGEMLSASLGSCKVAVITDSTVEGLYLPVLTESLTRAGFTVDAFVFPAGERSKNMGTLTDALEFLADKRLTRGDCVLALGGGVPGDLAGFAAGCFLRGVRYVQLPTTLLGAVDSSVGGKTAVDLRAGKNLAGLFYQPSAVICDTAAFSTLPENVFASGAAEAVKTGVLAGEALFSLLEEPGALRQNLNEIVYRCVSHKARVVEADEREQGVRKTLNLGHTAAHGIEVLSGYAVPHGQAVAIGMAILARAALKLGWTEDAAFPPRLIRTLKNNGLPVSTVYSPKDLAEAALSDKKRTGDTITLAVPRGIGDCVLREVPVGELSAVFGAGWEDVL